MKNRVVSILTIAMICLVCASGEARANPDQSQTKKPGLRVMTYNVLNGGTRRGQPLSQTAKAIQASGADIVVSPYPSDHRAMVATFTLIELGKTNSK